MKKLFTLMLVLLLAIALTGCVLDETDPDNTDPIINTPIYTVAFDSDGGSVVEPLTVEEGDMISRPQIPMKKGYMFVYWYSTNPETEYDFTTIITNSITLTALWEEIDYSYDINDIPEEIQYYLGESSFNHISDWIISDDNLDGEISEEEILSGYELVDEMFGGYDHNVVLNSEDLSDMQWCIDGSMDQEYIDAAIYAISYFNGIEWVNASYIIEDDFENNCSSYKFTFTWITVEDLYDELYDSYIYEGYDEDLAHQMAMDFSMGAIAFNSLGLDYENEDYYHYGSTGIYFIFEAMEELTQTEKNFVALHEMGHSFGLDDIYDIEFAGYTLMFGSAEGQDELLPILRPFDLWNLNYIYNNTEEEEVVE